MKINKTTIIGILLVVSLIFGITQMILSSYNYDNQIESYWKLSDKASTIKQKAVYVDKFIMALEQSGLEGTNDAIILTTPNNSFDRNLEQLKTLQSRLHSIDTMDIQSFAYQTAIQQITDQEQGEAQSMLSVFKGSWYLVHYWYLWNWLSFVVWIGWTILLVFWIYLFGNNDERDWWY